MGIRQTLNENRAVAAVLVAVLLGGGAAYVYFAARPPVVDGATSDAPRLYYTTDASTSDAAVAALFAEDATRIPPFDHNGKPAVRAYVWTTDGGKTRFVTHFTRFTPDAKKRLDALVAASTQKGFTPLQVAGAISGDVSFNGGLETKLAGQANWTTQDVAAQIEAALARDARGKPVTAVSP
jgi:hypothetical protein